jgi:VWFA-related protein
MAGRRLPLPALRGATLVLVGLLAPGASNLAAGAAAEQPQEPPPIPSPLIERVEVRFVTFDLIVEKRGRRVRDLRKDEVRVKVGGDPVEVEQFENTCIPGEAGGTPPTTRAASSGANPSGGSAAGTAVVANGVATGATAQSTHYILYFELNHMTVEGRGLAYSAAKRWAASQARPDDEVMILTGGNGLQLVRSFLPASQRLREDLEAAERDIGNADSWYDSEPARYQEILDLLAEEEMGEIAKGTAAARADSYGSFEEARARHALQNMEQVLALFQGVEGTKNLLLFEERFRLLPGTEYPDFRSPGDTKPYLDRVARAANEKNVRIYPVHAPGEDLDLADNAMTHLASETGGKVVERTNALEAGFERVVEDESCSYRLGFHLPRRANGQSERIDVTVRDGRGYSLSYRRTVGDPTREAETEEAVRAALLEPRRATGVALTLTAAQLTMEPDGGRMLLRVSLPLGSLAALPAASPPGAHQVEIDVGLTVVYRRPEATGEGSSSASSPWADARADRTPWEMSRGATLQLPPGRSASGEVVLEQEIFAPAGRYRLIAVARDRAAADLGAATLAFEVLEGDGVLGVPHLARPAGEAYRLQSEDAYAKRGGRRREEIVPSARLLADPVSLVSEQTIESGRPGSIVQVICDTGAQTEAKDERSAGAPSFSGWRLVRKLRCGDAVVPLPQAVLAPAAAGESCALVVVPFPAEPLTVGSCRAVITLERPGADPQTRTLEFTVVSGGREPT